VGAAILPSNWSTYGFGTPAFRDMFQVALEATKYNGIVSILQLVPARAKVSHPLPNSRPSYRT